MTTPYAQLQGITEELRQKTHALGCFLSTRTESNATFDNLIKSDIAAIEAKLAAAKQAIGL